MGFRLQVGRLDARDRSSPRGSANGHAGAEVVVPEDVAGRRPQVSDRIGLSLAERDVGTPTPGATDQARESIGTASVERRLTSESDGQAQASIRDVPPDLTHTDDRQRLSMSGGARDSQSPSPSKRSVGSATRPDSEPRRASVLYEAVAQPRSSHRYMPLRRRSRGRGVVAVAVAIAVLAGTGLAYQLFYGSGQNGPLAVAGSDAIETALGTSVPLLAEAAGVRETGGPPSAAVSAEAAADTSRAGEKIVTDQNSGGQLAVRPAVTHDGDASVLPPTALQTPSADSGAQSAGVGLPTPLTRSGVSLADGQLSSADATAVDPPRAVSATTPVRLEFVRPDAELVEAALSTEAALSDAVSLARLEITTGRAATPIPKPRDVPDQVARVAVAPVANVDGRYAVQLASYRSAGLAEQAAAKLTVGHLETLGVAAAQVVPAPSGLFRVMSARMEQLGDAETLCDRLKARGQDCLVVQQ